MLSEQDLIFFDEILEYLVFQLQFVFHYVHRYDNTRFFFFSVKLLFTLTRAPDFDQHSCVAKDELLSLVLFCAQLNSHGDKVAADDSCNTK